MKPINIHSLLHDRLLKAAGLQDIPPATPKYTLSSLIRSEWNSHFETLMRNRLLMGALRYGPLYTPNKPQYDRISSMEKRLHKYRQTGNLELLVDVANLCLCEFSECNHPLKHFHSADGDSREGVKQSCS